jgi:hypothetical protein
MAEYLRQTFTVRVQSHRAGRQVQHIERKPQYELPAETKFSRITVVVLCGGNSSERANRERLWRRAVARIRLVNWHEVPGTRGTVKGWGATVDETNPLATVAYSVQGPDCLLSLLVSPATRPGILVDWNSAENGVPFSVGTISPNDPGQRTIKPILRPVRAPDLSSVPGDTLLAEDERGRDSTEGQVYAARRKPTRRGKRRVAELKPHASGVQLTPYADVSLAVVQKGIVADSQEIAWHYDCQEQTDHWERYDVGYLVSPAVGAMADASPTDEERYATLIHAVCQYAYKVSWRQ